MDTIKYFLILISSFLLYNCSHEDPTSLDSYTVKVENNFFESIDSICIGDYYIGHLGKDSISCGKDIKSGQYSLSCKTASDLKITSSVAFQGKNKDVMIVIHSNGTLSIE